MDAGGMRPGNDLSRRALLSRDEANLSRRRPVEAERSGDRRMHDPPVADIQAGGEMRVVIESRHALCWRA